MIENFEVNEEQLKIIDDMWKLEIEVYNYFDWDYQTSYYGEQGGETSLLTNDTTFQTAKFTLEIIKDENKQYLVSNKLYGDMFFYKEIWTSIIENVLLLE